MANIMLTARDGGATTSANGAFINLSGPTIVKIKLDPKEISQLSRNGNDLVITLKSGETTTVHNYFVVDKNGNGNELVLEDAQGALWWVKDPQAGLHFEPLGDIDALMIEEAGGDSLSPWLFAAAGGLAAAAVTLALADDKDDHHRNVIIDDGDSDGSTGGGTTENPDKGNPPDVTPPFVAVLHVAGNGVAISANGATNDSTPTISGLAEPGSTVTIYDGTNILGTTKAAADGSWSITLPRLGDSTFDNLTVVATDAAGNRSEAAHVPGFTVDTLAPDAVSDITVLNDRTGASVAAGGSLNDSTPTLSGKGEPGSTVTIFNGGTELGHVVVGADGSWSLVLPELADGTYDSLTAVATDAAGNASDPITLPTFTIDTAAPAAVSDLVITNDETGAAVSAGGSLNDSTPTLSGKGEPGSTVTIFDGETELGHAVVGADGSWTLVLPELADGTYSGLTATATDAAGNVSAPVTLPTFTIDTAAPAAVSDLVITNDETGAAVAAGGSLNDSTPTLSGKGEPGSTVTIFDGETELGHAVVGADGSWT
ncbi:Ig-like domain-containing protein, partial [uncultured Pluralibacter sp.]|uniref:Ig-like domain-containing protein n=1 Tax=uncultured Pluralibacter sp. TaxID=1490864 RepID=UPI00260A7186